MSPQGGEPRWQDGRDQEEYRNRIVNSFKKVLKVVMSVVRRCWSPKDNRYTFSYVYDIRGSNT